ncbi:hypothetical protein ACFYXC_13165 [Streptomyces sp. NPDC002701]|uniref:hypothetical protein n=1 Tax=Streptomyces sp. NPDC002701 TaxID=3364661 RepID=UPI0036B7C785
MNSYFIDGLAFITPLDYEPGIKLSGQVMAQHRIPLNLALLACHRQHHDVTVDLTDVHYLSESALDILVTTAHTLPPPGSLTLTAPPELNIPERLAAHGWPPTTNLRLAHV